MSTTVAVAGATRRFGALPRELLRRGIDVRVVTREPRSQRAAQLRRIGAEVARGDFEDLASLTDAARGADAFLAGGTAHRVGPDGELRHGVNAADAAKAAGVGHLVLARPSAFVARRIELASDESTGEQIAQALSRAWRRVELQRVEPRTLPAGIGRLFEWLERVGDHVDIPALQASYPEVAWTSLTRWAWRQDWAQLASVREAS